MASVSTEIELPNDYASKWAMVCSTPDDAELHQKLIDFSSWYLEKLMYEAAQIGILLNYEKKPELIITAKPGDLQSCHDAYQTISTEKPGVLLVIHILPKGFSKEHEWMKTLANRFGLLRQGILCENALSRFENLADVSSVFRNMAQWIVRSGIKLMQGNPYNLRVGPGAKPTHPTLRFNQADIEEAVRTAFHGSEVTSNKNVGEVMLRVSGYPPSLNHFGVAQLLAPFRVIGISQHADNTADVELENIFHAMQAVSFLHGKKIDRDHSLSVEPIGEQLRARLQT